jgi:hypothetical protein
MRQVELIEPKVICSLGNFATKLLRGDPTGITRLHGRSEVRVIGTRAVRLYPVYHPAAALYTPANVEVLRSDFQQIPELLAMDPPPQPALDPPPQPAMDPPPRPAGAAPAPAAEPGPEPEPVPAVPEPLVAVQVSDEQLGLF